MTTEQKSIILFIIAIILFFIPLEGLAAWLWNKVTKQNKNNEE